MNAWQIFGIAAAAVAAIILLVVFGGGYITYRMTFYHNPKKDKVNPYKYIKYNDTPLDNFAKSLIDDILKVPCSDIFITSHDGLRLRGRLYMQDANAPFAIQFHGYKSTPMIDFSGGGLLAMEYGFNVIMVDERANGESEGRTISFSYNESRDVLSWVEYVIKNYGKERKIMLFGVSMGASTVILASGNGLPENVVGVVADCPYSSAREIITKVIYDMKLPGKILYPLVRIGAKIYGGFDPDMAEPYSAVGKEGVNILLIHGEEDDFVPCDMSRKMAAASSRCELHTFPEASHGLSYIYDTERYKRIATEFCDRCLNKAKK